MKRGMAAGAEAIRPFQKRPGRTTSRRRRRTRRTSRQARTSSRRSMIRRARGCPWRVPVGGQADERWAAGCYDIWRKAQASQLKV
eukprot:9168077-Alexandrium_andersonii.AAC.1